MCKQIYKKNRFFVALLQVSTLFDPPMKTTHPHFMYMFFPFTDHAYITSTQHKPLKETILIKRGRLISPVILFFQMGGKLLKSVYILMTKVFCRWILEFI